MLELDAVRALCDKHSLPRASAHNAEKTLAELAETMYETLMQAVIYDLPIVAAFAELHLAKMADKSPDIARVLATRGGGQRTTFLRELERRYQERYRIAEIDDLPHDERQLVLTLARQLKDKPALVQVLREIADNIDNME